MSRTWRDREEGRMERPSFKELEDWKKQAREEMEDMATGDSVYIIVNEWLPVGGDTEVMEILESRYFRSEDEAWESLALVAEAYSVDLDFDETSFDLPGSDGISKQVFYIQELNHG